MFYLCLVTVLEVLRDTVPRVPRQLAVRHVLLNLFQLKY